MLSATVRLLVGIVGAILVFVGLLAAIFAFSFAEGPFEGLWLVIIGVVLIVAVLVERHRYRSEAADRAFDPVGPGGGELAGAVEARFRPTDELFVDPTTGHRMRVHLDPGTGERRYVAEG